MDDVSVGSQAKGPVNRTGMGEYVPPPGSKPLTSLGGWYPGPSDYSPKAERVLPSAPRYSVQGRYVNLTSNAPPVGPADNDAGGDLLWKSKKVSLKQKGETHPYDVRRNAHINDSIGPGRYKVDADAMGTHGPKHSVASRHRDGVHAGPPNSLIQPMDTLGADTPGPNYRPVSERGPKAVIGLSRKEETTDGPGPAEYDTRTSEPSGPYYSLAARLPPDGHAKQAQNINDISPGPKYDLGTTMGKGPGATVKSRHYTRQREFLPGPDEYTLPDTIGGGPTAVLTYKPFEMEDRPHPGPTKYTIKDTNLRKAPNHEFGKKTKPSYPEVLHYPHIAQPESEPAPCDYNEGDYGVVNDNDGPKYSMGRPAKRTKNTNPGPNAYRVRDNMSKKKVPSFSMGRRVHTEDSSQSGPGPAAYFPQIAHNSKKGFSLTKRNNKTTDKKTPGANAYDVSYNQTTNAPKYSLRSRPSPFVYSGFHNVNMIRS